MAPVAQPGLDGWLSILLIFPVVFFGARLASATPLLKSRKLRFILGILLVICVLLAWSDPLVAFLPLLLIFTYGIACSIHIVLCGFGRRRFLISAGALAWLILCFAAYSASVTPVAGPFATNEIMARAMLGELYIAEQNFIDPTRKGAPHSLLYGTIEELSRGHFLYEEPEANLKYHGYCIGEVVELAKQQFLFYAVPRQFSKIGSRPKWSQYVPGGSLWYAEWHRADMQGTGVRSFAVDETGKVRYTTSPTPVPVARDEAAHLTPLR